MKKVLLPALLFFSLSSFAIEEGHNCGPDSTLTTSVVISTGINAAISETTLYPAFYGGNAGYPTANNDTDQFWVLSKLASIYTQRGPNPFAYLPSYLTVGQHPYLISNGPGYTPVYDHWASFTGSGTCTPAIAYSGEVTRWISPYSDAGGQNGSIIDTIGDDYIAQRCFYVCNSDSFNLSMNLLADDVVDSVWIDSTLIYSSFDPFQIGGYLCSSTVSINFAKQLGSGQHWIKVAFRDVGGGHVGLNVYGTVTSLTNSLSLKKSKYFGACSLFSSPETGVASSQLTRSKAIVVPNPSNGNFSINLSSEIKEADAVLIDAAGRVVDKRRIRGGVNSVTDLNLSQGLYMLQVKTISEVMNIKLLIQ